MPDISTELNNIKNVRYGKDVRKSIHDGIKKVNDIEDPEYTGPAEYWDTVDTQQNGIGARGPWVVWGGWDGSHAYNPSHYNFLVTDDGTCKAMDWITGSRAELKKKKRHSRIRQKRVATGTRLIRLLL